MHDHDEVADVLNQLGAALAANNTALTHSTLDLFWARLAIHIRAEHLHLFPAIMRAANRGSLSGQAFPPDEPEKTITKLRHDHDFFMRELAATVAITRRLLANAEADVAGQLEEVSKKIAEVRTRLVKHNEIEEQGIYLWSTSLLSEAERSELVAQVHKELENLPPRFGVICQESMTSG